MARIEIDWASPEYFDALSIEQGDRIYYHPGYLRAVRIGVFGRFLNRHFGISPFEHHDGTTDTDPSLELRINRAAHSFDSDAPD